MPVGLEVVRGELSLFRQGQGSLCLWERMKLTHLQFESLKITQKVKFFRKLIKSDTKVSPCTIM